MQQLFRNEIFNRLKQLCLVNASEELHLLLDLSLDSLESGSEKLSGVKALTLLVLACLNVAACSVSEYELALCVNIDLSNAKGNSLLYHVIRDTCTAVEYEGHIANSLVYSFKSFKAESLPVVGIYAVDITDTGSEEINTEISDLLALVGVSTLASADNAVLFAADSANLSLDRKTKVMSNVYKQIFRESRPKEWR